MSFQISRAELKRIVVAIDPAGSSEEDADDTGIIVCARGPHQPSTCKLGDICTGHGYVLDDKTCHLKPHGWAKKAIDAYDKWKADRIVAEKNFGGEMVEATIRAVRVGVPYAHVHASRGKAVRAEPVSALWEQGRCHMMGTFAELETELETWTPDSNWSPNRLDALVWGMTYLGLIGDQGAAFLQAYKQEAADRKAKAEPADLKYMPKMSHDAEAPPLRKGCQHRYFGDEAAGYYCVLCGGRLVREDQEG